MPNLLDVDPSILESNLLLKELQGGSDELTADSLFNIKPKDPDETPWKPVKPIPGYCVKLFTLEGDKVFVNVCHTDAIPEPIEISEKELADMLTDDSVPSFRIPISIGDLHIESDKSRNPCSVYDIAVNSKFFKKMETSEVFNIFFLNVSIAALQEKYSLNLDLKSEKPFLLLKNRKVLGNLQIHRIQQREVKKAPGQLIQEIDSNQTQPKKSLIQVISETKEKSPDKSSSSLDSALINEHNKSKEIKKNNSISNSSNSMSNKQDNLVLNNLNKHQKGNNKPSTPEEKGMAECRTTKEDFVQKLEPAANKHRREEMLDTQSDLQNDRRNEEVSSCPSLFCIKQYPEVGHPDFLVASVRLNVSSSRDFDLQLDDNRLNITLTGSKKPWFDVYLPYNIDVNKVEACFVTESQVNKLVIRMDVLKS